MTLTTPAGTTPADNVRVVPLTMSTAEVRLDFDGATVSIGKVATAAGRWYWQHRDGEQSSPIAENRMDAATALAAYHRAFKPQPAHPAPAKRLLFS
jgi:hypothetical protein